MFSRQNHCRYKFSRQIIGAKYIPAKIIGTKSISALQKQVDHLWFYYMEFNLDNWGTIKWLNS